MRHEGGREFITSWDSEGLGYEGSTTFILVAPLIPRFYRSIPVLRQRLGAKLLLVATTMPVSKHNR